MRPVRPLAALLVLACMLAGPRAEAREMWASPGGQGSFTLKSALEGAGLLSTPRPGAASLPGWDALGFGRLRLEAREQPSAAWSFDAAYDNRLSLDTAAGSVAASALPTSAPVPFRIRQLGGTLAERGQALDYHELDRASVSFQGDRARVVAGRQAIGWGRGVLFSAVDVFAPFTPLEIDREWRRGVDGLSADVKLTGTSSVGLVSAWGPDWKHSAVGGRLRGFVGVADAELLVARRAEDQLFGATCSLAAGEAELHAEASVVHTPGDQPGGGLAGDRDLVLQAVLGASNNFLLGSGLKVTLEVAYSGFGASQASGLASLVANPAFVRRYLRGDTQLIGRQAVAMVGNYTLDPAWSASVEVLQSLMDPSGVIATTAAWTVSDRCSLAGTVYVAYGPGPLGSLPMSQFGSTPPTALLQLKLYD